MSAFGGKADIDWKCGKVLDEHAIKTMVGYWPELAECWV
jgi:hypothetical protein